MTRYVIDASVAIKWFLPDAADEANALQALDLFLRLRAAEVSLVQPAHWKAEVASMLARRVPATAAADLDDLNLLEGIQIIDTPLIHHRAVELAIGLSHHLFDTLYHATALENEAVMITVDRRVLARSSGGRHRLTARVPLHLPHRCLCPRPGFPLRAGLRHRGPAPRAGGLPAAGERARRAAAALA